MAALALSSLDAFKVPSKTLCVLPPGSAACLQSQFGLPWLAQLLAGHQQQVGWF